MRHFIVICLFAFPIVGCVRSGRETALRVWQSQDSTLEQRAHAVSELFPVGASQQSVVSVLGTNGGWARFHGPSIDAYHPQHTRQLPDFDETYWSYKFSGGSVLLVFDPPASDGGRFVRAVPSRLLFTVPSTNAP
jgi:hypothetical protein